MNETARVWLSFADFPHIIQSNVWDISIACSYLCWVIYMFFYDVPLAIQRGTSLKLAMAQVPLSAILSYGFYALIKSLFNSSFPALMFFVWGFCSWLYEMSKKKENKE